MIFYVLFVAAILFMPFGYLISKQIWQKRGSQMAAELDRLLSPDERVQAKALGKITQGFWTSNAMLYLTKDRIIYRREIVPLVRKSSAIALKDISDVAVRKMWFASATVQIKYNGRTMTFYPTKDSLFPDSKAVEALAATIDRARGHAIPGEAAPETA